LHCWFLPYIWILFLSSRWWGYLSLVSLLSDRWHFTQKRILIITVECGRSSYRLLPISIRSINPDRTLLLYQISQLYSLIGSSLIIIRYCHSWKSLISLFQAVSTLLRMVKFRLSKSKSLLKNSDFRG
jgi:hypothetical protein